MTLLPLDEIRLNARSHASALRWVGLLYHKSMEVKKIQESLPPFTRVIIFLRLYFHALPYLVLVCVFGRWSLCRLIECGPISASLKFHELGFYGYPLAVGLGTGLVLGLSFGLAVKLFLVLASNLTRGGGRSLMRGFAEGLGGWSLVYSLATSLVVGIIWGATDLVRGAASGLGLGLVVSIIAVRDSRALGLGLGSGLIFGVTLAFLSAGGLAFSLAYSFAALRLYYFPFHFFCLQLGRAEFYRLHPVAWDDACHLPFPGFDQLLVRYAEHDPEAGEREIDRLIDEYPSQRPAALRARAILLARRAGAVTDLARLDELLASLPDGEKGFLKETPELRRRVHEITILQVRLDTLDRPFLREPFAALLVKEIEIFEQQIAGFKPPLSTEFRKAARQWLVIAQRQFEAARAAANREPTSQVFRAGDPVDREREAFVPRALILGALERQVMLATGCPGLLVYGRRRMGKSTLLRNLEGLLPPRVLVVSLSMQEARAFTSTPDLVALIFQRVAAIVSDAGELPVDLKGFERFLGATQKRLDADDRRLLLAIDEYENLDSKIGEGALSEDLLAVIRESIQTHRRLIWAFAGSHGIDELTHAPWTSYLVSARTIEVTPFEPAETRLLLTEPLKHSSLWRASKTEPPRFEPGFWGEGGIERIHAEAGGWPHLVQLIAETVVDLVNDAGGASVDGALLERALDRAVVRGNNVFLELLERESRLPGEWDYLRGFRRVEEQPVPDDEALDRSLRRRRLVIEEDGNYRLRVPLMGRWLRERV